MGFFSGIFGGRKSSGIVSGKNPGKGWTAANRFNKARGGYAGGWAAIAFGNIMNAHCSPEDIVEEFGLDKDDNLYGCDAYLIAYQEQYDEAFKEYEDLMGYYMELIEMNESLIHENEEEIERCEEDIEELEEEIEELREEMAECEDPFEAEDIRSEIEDLQQEIQELREYIQELQEENARYQNDIIGWYAEMDTISVEDMIDYDEIDKKAMEYACEFAQQWINGDVWIPHEVLDWAFYDISDHNK